MAEATPDMFRQLASGDINLFRQMLDMFGAAFDDPDRYVSAQPGDEYLAGLLNTDHFIALAAVAGNAVIGGLAAYELKKFEQERREIYIYDLAVMEQHRRRGVATGLIDTLKTIAASRNVHAIFVQADLEDQPAIELYAKLGIRADVLHFDIPVD